jgi:hypothetical protein
MHSMLRVLATPSDVANLIGGLGQFLTGLAALIGVAALWIGYQRDKNDKIRLESEQRRISYRNLNITHSHTLTRTEDVPLINGVSADRQGTACGSEPPSGLTQFSIFRLRVKNIGDGPVDVWACLVAARELNIGDHIRSWGGHIEWDDLRKCYFDDDDRESSKMTEDELSLAGISTTQHCVYSQDDYLILDPGEADTLTRIDRIKEVKWNRTLVYRTFLVGQGHGLKSEQPARRRRSPRGQAPFVAQRRRLRGLRHGKLTRGRSSTPERDYDAWQGLQQALFNISGPSFRILFGDEDPLGLVADRDGWQCFMLYHRAFVVESRDGRGWTEIDKINAKLEGPDGVTTSKADAKTACREVLENVHKGDNVPKSDPYRGEDGFILWRRHWGAFKEAVARCKELPNGFYGLIQSDSNWKPTDSGVHLHNDKLDLTLKRPKQIFDDLPRYLQWDLEDDDSLPIWEHFFVVTLSPEALTETLRDAAPPSSALASRLLQPPEQAAAD